MLSSPPWSYQASKRYPWPSQGLVLTRMPSYGVEWAILTACSLLPTGSTSNGLLSVPGTYLTSLITNTPCPWSTESWDLDATRLPIEWYCLVAPSWSSLPQPPSPPPVLAPPCRPPPVTQFSCWCVYPVCLRVFSNPAISSLPSLPPLLLPVAILLYV